MASLGRQILRGSALSYGSFLGAKLVAFLSMLILVRLLVPADFGLVGYALIVLGLLDIVKNLGITQALIYRQDIADADAGEAFALAMAMALILFGICWLLAPVAGHFFHDSRVIPVTRVLALTLLLDALGGVHAALLQKHLRFGRLVIPDVALSVTKGVVAVLAALLGAGYWSLVAGQLAGMSLWTVTNWWLFPWWPRIRVRWASARRLLGYGLHILLVDFVGAVILTADNLVVGRLLGIRALGLYAVAFTIPQMITIGLAVAVSNACFPALSRIQANRGELERYYLLVQRYSAAAIVPAAVGLFASTPSLVHALFGREWWSMSTTLQLLALFALVQAMVWSAGDLYKAIGRPDMLWKLGFAQALAVVAAVIIGAELGGIVGVAWARIAIAVPFALITWWWVHRLLGVELTAIGRALRAPLIAGAVMLAVMELLDRSLAPLLGPVAVLAAQLTAGVAVYTALMLRSEPHVLAVLRARRQTSAAAVR
jgi:PST family polysaccharide transporter